MTNTMQSEYRNLPFDALTESPNDPRKNFDEAGLNDYRLKAGRLMLRLKVAGLRLKPPERRFG